MKRCKCGQIILADVDKSRPAELVEWKGMEWTKTKPQFMWMYPSKEVGDKCFYCRNTKE